MPVAQTMRPKMKRLVIGAAALMVSLSIGCGGGGGTGGGGGGGGGDGGSDAGVVIDPNPARLAKGLSFPGAVVVEGDRVLWVNEGSTAVGGGGLSWGGSVTSIARTGGASTTLASFDATPYSLASGGDHLFWINTYPGSALPYELTSMPITGGAPAAVPDGGLPYAVSEGWLYLVRGDILYRRPAGGGAEEMVAAAEDVYSIAARGAHVYWTLHDGGVMRVDLGGGTPALVASQGACSTTLAVDDAHVYWIQLVGCSGDKAVIQRAKLTGGDAEMLQGTQGAQHFVLDGSDVLFATSSNIVKLPKAGGAATVLADTSFPGGLATDGTYVFWTNGMNTGGDWESGELWRAPR